MLPQLSDLKESNDFLKLLLDNINSAVLIADENMQIHQFNKSFLDLFDRATDQPVDHSFGRIAGCVNAVAENRSCGQTSQCRFCSIRRSLLQTLVDEAPVDRRRLERQFYINGLPVTKYLEFSARPIRFQGRRMILVSPITPRTSPASAQRGSSNPVKGWGATFSRSTRSAMTRSAPMFWTSVGTGYPPPWWR